jgi:hypothetical protein
MYHWASPKRLAQHRCGPGGVGPRRRVCRRFQLGTRAAQGMQVNLDSGRERKRDKGREQCRRDLSKVKQRRCGPGRGSEACSSRRLCRGQPLRKAVGGGAQNKGIHLVAACPLPFFLIRASHRPGPAWAASALNPLGQRQRGLGTNSELVAMRRQSIGTTC